MSVVSLVVTSGQNKLTHVALMSWAKLSVQAAWVFFFVLEQVKFSRKERM